MIAFMRLRSFDFEVLEQDSKIAWHHLVAKSASIFYMKPYPIRTVRPSSSSLHLVAAVVYTHIVT